MIIDILINWAVPFICGGAVTGCFAYVSSVRKRNTALEDGVECLLRAEIIRNHDKYVELGNCPIYAKEALKRVYSAYHELGGNDVATRLYETVMLLPAESKKRRTENDILRQI